MRKDRNLDGLPLKYFNVPPGNEFDYEACSVLMEQIQILNNTIANLTSGSDPVDTDYYVSILSNIMGSLLYQVTKLQEVGQ